MELRRGGCGRDVRIDSGESSDWPSKLMQTYPQQIKSVKLGRPTLEDVFIQKTGHEFWQATNSGFPQ